MTEILHRKSHMSGPLHFAGKVTSSSPKTGGKYSTATNIGQIAIHQFILEMWEHIGTTSKPNRWLTGGSIWFLAVSIVLNNDNHVEPDGTAGQPPVEFWSRPLQDGCVISNSLWPMTAAITATTRMDTLESLSMKSLPVSLLAQLIVGPPNHTRLVPV